MQRLVLVASVAAALIAPGAEAAQRQRTTVATADVLARDQELGRSFRVGADDLPAPGATPAVANAPLYLPFKGHTPKVPEGFTATLFAKLEHPRRLLVLPNGDVIVAEQKPGRLTLLRAGANGKAEFREQLAGGFNQPYGLAWRDGEILVADQDAIWKVAHVLGKPRGRQDEDKQAAEAGAKRPRNGQVLLTPKGVFGRVRGHSNRPLAIDRKTGALFVGVGSSGNIDIEPEVKASIQRFEADGSNQNTYASGLRNTCGLALNPDTGELWAVVQERDGLGDRLVPDYLVRPDEGDFYGWPYAYTGQHPQPGFASRSAQKVKASKRPDLLFESHSSAMDLVFYDGQQFPADYRGSAFVVLKGSWNRSDPTGYKVVRVPFQDGRPVGSYENFMTGFWVSGRARAEVWRRPAAIALMPDGALLVADDVAGSIWRVAYQGARKAEAGSDAAP